MSIYVLHGEPKFALSKRHGSLTSKCKLPHEYEPGSCPSNHQQHAENRNECMTAHSRAAGSMRTKKRQSFNHGSHFGSVVGVSSGTSESGMSLGGDDGTKHDIKFSMRGSCNNTIQQEFHHQQREYHHL